MLKYVVSYTIRDGEHEYADSLKVCFPAEPSDEQVIHALIEEFTHKEDDQILSETKQNAWARYLKNHYLEIPCDYRLIDDIAWRRDAGRRVLITVSGGVAEYAVDRDVAVCLIDWDSEPNRQVPPDFADLAPELRNVS